MIGPFLLLILAASSIGMKPEFEEPFVNAHHDEGRWMILVCKAKGERPMTYKWYNQNEDELTEDDNQLVYVQPYWNNDSALVFRNLSREHEGFYTCIASNAHGLASMVFNLSVLSNERAAPEFRTPFESLTLEENRSVPLWCSAEGKQPMTYKWSDKNDDEITEDHKQTVFAWNRRNESFLFFKSLTYEQGGPYMCNASNDYGQASKVFYLTVIPTNGTVPEFRTPFKNVTLTAGISVHLLCRAEGEQPMTYKWYNESEDEMTEDDQQPIFVRTYERDSTLVFRNLSYDQEGLYTCNARNAHGNATKVFYLTVNPPNGTVPKFRTPFENLTLAAGRYVSLLCSAEGEHPMTYRWYDHQSLAVMTEDDRQPIFVRTWERDSSLVFRNLTHEQNGLYTCTANNTYGMAGKAFYLTVTSPNDGNDTDIDQGNGTSRFRDAKVLKYSTRSVTFSIVTSGPVKYIEVRYGEARRESNTTTLRLLPAPRNNSYEIRNLLPGRSYSFQFRTVPSDSNRWSRLYNVTTLGSLLPEAPDVILEGACDRSVRLRLFTKTQDFLKGSIDKHQIKYFKMEMANGNRWTSRNCTVATEVETCVGSSHTIYGLERTVVYQIEVRAHNEAGYGEPWRQKVYLP